MYSDDNDRVIVTLTQMGSTIVPVISPSGAPQPNRQVQWYDLLYAYTGKNRQIYQAPGVNNGFGIGINHPNIGYCNVDQTPAVVSSPWSQPHRSTPHTGKSNQPPTATVIFADAATISSNTPASIIPTPEKPPAVRWDLFERPPAAAAAEPPSGVGGGSSDRVLVVMMAGDGFFIDGHAESQKPSELGFQYPQSDPRHVGSVLIWRGFRMQPVRELATNVICPGGASVWRTQCGHERGSPTAVVGSVG
jgi:hypothetical protein